MSALAFNGHRIHSDYRYVTQVEHYPDLVVPGSLHTLVMFELARQYGGEGGREPRYRSIAWRNMRPLFVERPFTACGEPAADGKSARLWVTDNEGGLAVSATAEFF
jgi:3-methylfumaryl-CoA hydratase